MINAKGQDPEHFKDHREGLFRLIACFWLFYSTSGDMSEFAVVHFTTVLGNHRQALAFKSAYIYRYLFGPYLE